MSAAESATALVTFSFESWLNICSQGIMQLGSTTILFMRSMSVISRCSCRSTIRPCVSSSILSAIRVGLFMAQMVLTSGVAIFHWSHCLTSCWILVADLRRVSIHARTARWMLMRAWCFRNFPSSASTVDCKSACARICHSTLLHAISPSSRTATTSSLASESWSLRLFIFDFL